MKHYSKHFMFAFRVMAKTPLITALSIMVLSLSIALATLMFNMIEGILMAKLPYEGGDRLMRIQRNNPENQYADNKLPFKTYEEFVEKQTAFDGIIGYFIDSCNLQVGLKAGQELGIYASPDFLDTLGVKPVMGRGFTEDDARAEAPPVAVISQKVWNEYFGGDPEVIGKILMVDGIQRTVIGVMPTGFDFPFVNHLWLPLNIDTLVSQTGWGSSLYVAGRIKEGTSLASASLQSNELFKHIKEAYPVENEGFQSLQIDCFKEYFIGQQTRLLFVAMGLCAGLILFMGCAIVSNLITVRSMKRSSELAIRSALGASRKQLVFQMLFESMITSIISLISGWLLMQWFNTAVLQKYYIEFNVPSWFFGGGINIRHYIFVVTILLTVTVASTLVPALRASRTSLNDLLKDSSRTGSSLKMSIMGRMLIIFQIAAACAVITGGAIIGYFLHDIRGQEFDYNPNQYLFSLISMNNNDHPRAEERVVFMKKFLQALDSRPEVSGATFSTEFYAGNLIAPIKIIGADYPTPDSYPKYYRSIVSPGYFEVMNTSLIAGRGFTDVDDFNHPTVVIVTDVMARQLFGDESPLGKQFIFVSGQDEKTVTVIGVVKDLYRSERDRDHRTGFFMSSYQETWMDFGLHIHIAGNPKAFEPILVQTLRETDPRVAVTSISTIRERTDSNLIGLDFIYLLFVTFSIGALIMAAAGLYGVVSFSVSQRIRELGIRLALGAAPLNIIFRVFRQGLMNAGIGMVFGVAGAYLLRYLLMMILNPLYESILVYCCVLLAVFAMSSISILVPAVRGGTTDPADALRID